MGDYGLAEHRHRFAVWAAARAAQRGFTTIEQLRAALESTDIRTSIAEPATLRATEVGFKKVHQAWCSQIRTHLKPLGGKATYGRAAKMVAVYLKTMVTLGDGCDTPFGRNLHPPIDRTLLRNLATCPRIESPHKGAWRARNWTHLDEDGYYALVDQLRAVLPPGAPFWTIEEFWQPTGSI